MEVVVDTNIIISSLIKPGITRKIIAEFGLSFITPAYTLSEINKYKEEICKKANFLDEEFKVMLNLIFKYIKIINPAIYDDYLEEAKDIIKDVKDIPFIATAIAFNSIIWSDDTHFKKQKIIKVLNTREMMNLFQ